MKIALLGYGKMGQAIEEIAVQRGHDIVLRISIDNPEENTIENIRKADVAIEFSSPESAFENVMKSFEAGVPVVCGSTGWLARLEEAKQRAQEVKGSFIYSSNFSVGVNLFFALNEKLAELMAKQNGYDVAITEIHHTEKKDAPSGTAISLAEQIIERLPYKEQWQNHSTSNPADLQIISERVDLVPGTHRVWYNSEIDSIEIVHTAHNRKGFATGAVQAAEFIRDKNGVFSMKDVLGL